MKKNKCSSKKYQKAQKPTSYFKGALLVVGASIMTAKLLPRISSKIYKESVKRSNHRMNDNEFGPIIEKIKK